MSVGAATTTRTARQTAASDGSNTASNSSSASSASSSSSSSSSSSASSSSSSTATTASATTTTVSNTNNDHSSLPVAMSFSERDEEQTWFDGQPAQGVRLTVHANRKRLLVNDQNHFGLPGVRGSIDHQARARLSKALGARAQSITARVLPTDPKKADLPPPVRIAIDESSQASSTFQSAAAPDGPTVFVSTRHTGHQYFLAISVSSVGCDGPAPGQSLAGTEVELWRSPSFELKTARQHRRLRSKQKKSSTTAAGGGAKGPSAAAVMGGVSGIAHNQNFNVNDASNGGSVPGWGCPVASGTPGRAPRKKKRQTGAASAASKAPATTGMPFPTTGPFGPRARAMESDDISPLSSDIDDYSEGSGTGLLTNEDGASLGLQFGRDVFGLFPIAKQHPAAAAASTTTAAAANFMMSNTGHVVHTPRSSGTYQRLPLQQRFPHDHDQRAPAVKHRLSPYQQHRFSIGGAASPPPPHPATYQIPHQRGLTTSVRFPWEPARSPHHLHTQQQQSLNQSLHNSLLDDSDEVTVLMGIPMAPSQQFGTEGGYREWGLMDLNTSIGAIGVEGLDMSTGSFNLESIDVSECDKFYDVEG